MLLSFILKALCIVGPIIIVGLILNAFISHKHNVVCKLVDKLIDDIMLK